MIGNPTDFYDAGNPATAWANPATFTEISPVLNLPAFHAVGADLDENEYTITMSAGANGTAVAAKSKAKAGETVTLTITPATGYIVDSIKVGTLDLAATATSFIMPSKNITITVAFVVDPAA